MIKEFIDYKVFIFVGHFGSGKTEVSVNFALNLRNFAHKINVVDMDIVNPFFRAVDFRDYLEGMNIKLVASKYAGSNIEMPSIPHNIPLLLNESNAKTILDVGGDDAGARILRVYGECIKEQKFITFCVVNIYRSETDSSDKILSMIRQIEQAAGIKVTALINNSNLSEETTARNIIKGQSILEEVSREISIPVAFACANEHLLSQLPKALAKNTLIHKVKVVYPWE